MTKSWSRGSNWRFAVCGKWLYINSIIGRQRKMAPLTSSIGPFMSFPYDICGKWYEGRGGRQQHRDFPYSFRTRVWFCVPLELTWERRMSPPKDVITQTETWSYNYYSKTFGSWSRRRDQCVSTSNKKNIYIVITWNVSDYHLLVNCSKCIITWHGFRFSKVPVSFRAPKAVLSVCRNYESTKQKLNSLWVRYCDTIQQVLISKFAFGPGKLRDPSRNGASGPSCSNVG